MSKYSATFSVAGVNTASTVYANLKAAANPRAVLLEVGVFLEVLPTTAPIIALQRMNAVGTGAITTATSAAHDAAEGAALTTLETAWATTRPTVTGGIIRRVGVPLALGNGIIFDFTNRPLFIGLSAGLCLLNVNASGATLGTFGGYFTWEE